MVDDGVDGYMDNGLEDDWAGEVEGDEDDSEEEREQKRKGASLYAYSLMGNTIT